MEHDPHPERVVLLGQVGEDVGVEHGGLQEAAPQSGQLGAELAHVPADLLRYLLVAFLQLMGTERIFSRHYLSPWTSIAWAKIHSPTVYLKKNKTEIDSF